MFGFTSRALVATAALLLVPAAAAESGAPAMPAFPELEGFSKKGEPMRFDPDSLFEYINGDAFNYQGFDFEALAVQEYAGAGGSALIAEIYRHGSANDGFGIYSYERPAEGRFLSLGGEGYSEKGVLNFFKDRFYVKLHGTGLGEAGEALLSDLAGAIADSIEGREGLPAVASGFPRDGLVANSVRFVSSHFLGHSFLHSAFVAEYELGGASARAFVIEGDDVADAERMVRDYLALVAKKGGSHEAAEGRYRFRDPYRSSEGELHLVRVGSRILGIFHDDAGIAEKFLGEVRRRLGGASD